MTETFLELKVKELQGRLDLKDAEINDLRNKITLLHKRLTHHLEQFVAHGGRKE